MVYVVAFRMAKEKFDLARLTKNLEFADSSNVEVHAPFLKTPEETESH